MRSMNDLNGYNLTQRWKDMTPSRLELLPDILYEVINLYRKGQTDNKRSQFVNDMNHDAKSIDTFCNKELYTYRCDHEQILHQMEQKEYNVSFSEKTSKLHRNVLALSATICIYPFLDLDTSQLKILGMEVGKTPLFTILIMALIILFYYLVSYVEHAYADTKRLIAFKLEYIARKRAAFFLLNKGAQFLNKNLKSQQAKECFHEFLWAFSRETNFGGLLTVEGYDPGNLHIHSFPRKVGFFYRLKFFGIKRALGYLFPVILSCAALIAALFAKGIHLWWQNIISYIFF